MPQKTRSLDRFRVPASRLYRRCTPEEVGTETTREIEPLEEFIGQERAHRAISFGLRIKGYGYNIYASGRPGTGKQAMIADYLERVSKELPTPSDWCYVYNFEEPSQPRALELPAGYGKRLKRDMAELVEAVSKRIQSVFESEEFSRQRDQLVQAFEQEKQKRMEEIQREGQQLGFIVQFTPTGIVLTPMGANNQPMPPQVFEALPEETKRSILERRKQLEERIKELTRELRQLEKQTQEQLRNLERQAVGFAIEPLFQELKETYGAYPQVVQYLEAVHQDMLKNIDAFRQKQGAQPPLPLPLPIPLPKPSPLKRYEVNVLVDNSGLTGAPVVMEPVPNYVNLVGRIEKEVQFGALTTDFTMIYPGALHRANGGFLVLEADELLRQPYAYQALKKALKTQQIRIEDLGETLGLVTTKVLKPEPIPLDVKVILTGSPLYYYLLYTYDEDFQELFKVRADFDVVMDRTPENIRQYRAFIARVVQRENLLPFTAEAIARVIEHSSRMVNDQKKLSTRFADIVDLLKECDYWARRQGAEQVEQAHVEQALEERIFRSNLLESKIQEMIARDQLIVDTEGQRVGVINGLAVLELGDFSFARPVRITATLWGGKEGVLDIEREVGLGGKIHSKGVLILTGYLSEVFARKEPLSLSARIAFEQNYSEIEGDSASSTELYVLLSLLSDLPLRQDIAVSGSVNQKGEIQPVGGINEKIEGFYRACKVKGLTGTQGVLIPRRNLENLMLHPEVVRAVEQGQFHIYAVDTVEEGIEILTGVPAGRRPDGTFEKGSVYDRVARRLQELREAARNGDTGRKKKDQKSRPASPKDRKR